MSLKRLFALTWILTTLLTLTGTPALALPLTSSASPLITSDANGVVIEWQTAAPLLNSDPAGNTTVQIDRLQVDTSPGAAQLPFESLLVALPPQGSARLEIIQSQARQQPFSGRLAVNPLPDTALQAAAAAVQQHVSLVEIGTTRGVRLARVTFYPVLPQDGQLSILEHVKIRVRFQAPAAADLNAAAQADSLVRQVQSQVINPSQVQSTLGTQTASDLPAAPAAVAQTAILEVSQAGVYQVTRAQLNTAGFSTSDDPRNLRLTRSGVDIPYEWVNSSGVVISQDATFDSGEILRFYAKPRFSRWSNTDTYLLTQNSSPAALISTLNVTPGTPVQAYADLLVEQNKLYTPDCTQCKIPFGRDGDPWAWDILSEEGTSTANYPFSLTNVDTSKTATVTLYLIGKTDLPTSPDHRVLPSINSHSLDPSFIKSDWDGKTLYNPTYDISGGWLNGSTIANTLTINVPTVPAWNGVDTYFLDAFNVRYPLNGDSMGNEAAISSNAPGGTLSTKLNATSGVVVYNVTYPNTPVRLTGVTLNGSSVTFGDSSNSSTVQVYQIANLNGVHTPTVRLQQPLNTSTVTGADYLVIAPKEFLATLTPLLNWRQTQGLSVALEYLQPIYDQFNEGRLDPEAIHQYLKTTYLNPTHWNPVPKYVLLVGDGTWDPKKYYTNSFNTIVPPYIKPNIDQFSTETATDNRLVTFDGDTDILPDMIIGRLPVNNTTELAVMVDKIIKYENPANTGTWRRQTMLVADYPFSSYGTQLNDLLPKSYFPPYQLYYKVNYSSGTALHTSLMTNWNKGLNLVFYTGHASVHFWGAENYLHINDVPLLTNGYKLPVVVEMTCFTGTFHMNGLSSLDEALVRQPGGGALAVWGSTTMGESTGQNYLASAFVNSLVNDANPGTASYLGYGRLGEATLAGRLETSFHPSFSYLIDSFTLFGDPASRVRLDYSTAYSTNIPFVKR